MAGASLDAKRFGSYCSFHPEDAQVISLKRRWGQIQSKGQVGRARVLDDFKRYRGQKTVLRDTTKVEYVPGGGGWGWPRQCNSGSGEKTAFCLFSTSM